MAGPSSIRTVPSAPQRTTVWRGRICSCLRATRSQPLVGSLPGKRYHRSGISPCPGPPTFTQVVPLAALFRSGMTHSLKLSFNYDKRDNRLFPTNGFLVSASGEWAPDIGLFKEENVFTRVVRSLLDVSTL